VPPDRQHNRARWRVPETWWAYRARPSAGDTPPIWPYTLHPTLPVGAVLPPARVTGQTAWPIPRNRRRMHPGPPALPLVFCWHTRAVGGGAPDEIGRACGPDEHEGGEKLPSAHCPHDAYFPSPGTPVTWDGSGDGTPTLEYVAKNDKLRCQERIPLPARLPPPGDRLVHRLRADPEGRGTCVGQPPRPLRAVGIVGPFFARSNVIMLRVIPLSAQLGITRHGVRT
jgi:hypothetical protein